MGRLVQGSVLVTRDGKVIFTPCETNQRSQTWPWHLLAREEHFDSFLARFGSITESSRSVVILSISAEEDELEKWFEAAVGKPLTK